MQQHCIKRQYVCWHTAPLPGHEGMIWRVHPQRWHNKWELLAIPTAVLAGLMPATAAPPKKKEKEKRKTNYSSLPRQSFLLQAIFIIDAILLYIKAFMTQQAEFPLYCIQCDSVNVSPMDMNVFFK